MRQKTGFVLREVCGEKVIIGEGIETVNFGKLISVNDTVAWVWQKAKELGEFTAEELGEAMSREFNVEIADAIADIRELLQSWQELGLTEG